MTLPSVDPAGGDEFSCKGIARQYDTNQLNSS
jgi:hypothetical protein